MLRRKLLTILFIFILLPVLVILFQSATTLLSQKKTTTDISGRYVQNLADYASDRWREGNPDRIAAFLSLVADPGFDRIISIENTSPPLFGFNKNDRGNISTRGKFIPGMVAYVTVRGELISFSQNAAILANIYANTIAESDGRALIERGGNIMGSFRLGSKYVTYVAHISPTDNPRVYAIAAVTMLSWMGRNDFSIMKLAAAGILGMLICLVALLLLRGSVIIPLKALSAHVNTLKWGSEMPSGEPAGGGAFGRMRVEEISSLNKAIDDLALRMIDKQALEKRYVGDIIKAQEDERGRIAQDIHDGPIQVVSALIQRLQIASLTPGSIPDDASEHLATAENIANDLVEDLRDICDSLVPPWVSLGVVSCMEEAASRFERQHSITINTNVDQELDIPQEITLALFRIFQEAVSNAVRHGGAACVNVDARRGAKDRMVEFRISDDGSGFEPTPEMMGRLVHEGKRGLNGMRQRVELLGGEYELSSEPGRGTAITIRI
ncbi:MAG: sensor histidine kinase [Synergistaceae bacterium]|nr:sensor histidine kinase [Synergistaceae bacterium]